MQIIIGVTLRFSMPMIRSMIPGCFPSPVLPVRTRNKVPGMTSHIDGPPILMDLKPSSTIQPLPLAQSRPLPYPYTQVSTHSSPTTTRTPIFLWPRALTLVPQTLLSTIYLKKVQLIVHHGFIIAMAFSPSRI